MYVVVTRYQRTNGKRPITHAYAEPEGNMTKKDAEALKRKILKDFRLQYPRDKGELIVNVLKVVDVSRLNSSFHVVSTDSWNPRKELQGPHQGPSGEVLI